MANDDQQANTPAVDEVSPAQNPLDFSALLETPIYDLVEKGADQQGYETRGIKPDDAK